MNGRYFTVLVIALAIALPLSLAAQSAGPLIIAANTNLPLPLPSLPRLSVSSGGLDIPGGSGLETIANSSNGGTVLLDNLTRPTPLRPKTIYRTKPGPWGELEYYVTYLQIPEHYLASMEMPSEDTFWHFPENDPVSVFKLLDEIGLPDVKGRPWRDALNSIEKIPTGGIRISPSAALLTAILPETRSRLAALLRRSKENVDYIYPVLVESGDALTWYRDAGLDEDTVQRIAALCYLKGNSLVFSNRSHVLSTLDTVKKKHRFLRTGTRTRSLVLRLNIGRTDDYEAIVDYWTAGHKHKALMPILESIGETPEVERIDVLHLLPPTPRRLLYTYPTPRDHAAGIDRDCHWTSSNFFRSRPYDLIGNAEVRGAVFTDSYRRAELPLRFGDVIVFSDPETKKIIHSVVYIADDIIFTKNGKTVQQPWILMRMADLLTHYTDGTDTSAHAFRLK